MTTDSDNAAAPAPAPVQTLDYATPPPPEGHWQQFRAFIKRLGPAGPLALFTATFPPLGSIVLLGSITRIAPWLREHQAAGLVICIGGFTALAALSLIPTYACSILSGWTFGFWLGFPASMAAFCGASIVAYLVNSRVAGHRVIDIVREHPKWEAVRVSLLDCGFWKAFWIITLLRLPPLSPFAAGNFILGTIRAPLGAFLLGTLVGMAPRTGGVVWAAAHASTLDFKTAGHWWSLVITIAVTLFVVAVIGHLANQAMRKIGAAAR